MTADGLGGSTTSDRDDFEARAVRGLGPTTFDDPYDAGALHSRFNAFLKLPREELMSEVCSLILDQGGMEFGLVATIAAWEDGTPTRARLVSCAGPASEELLGCEYDLVGTPCEVVERWSFGLVHDRAAERFPDDPILAEMGIESYVGASIFGLDGRPIGLLAGLARRPLVDERPVLPLIVTLAQRLGTELDRRAVEGRYQGLVESLTDGLIVYQDDRVVYANPAAVRMRGLDASDRLLGRSVREVSCDASETGVCERGMGVLRVGEERRWIEYSTSAVSHGGAPALRVIERDITERRRMEHLFEGFFAISPSPVCVVDHDGVVRRMNKSMRLMLCIEREPNGMPLSTWLHPDHAEEVGSLIVRALKEAGGVWTEYTHEDAHGIGRTFRWRGFANYDDDSVLLVPIDMTAQRDQERKARRAERTQTTALLASGLAHDLGNLISAIGAQLHLADQQLADEHPASSILSDAGEVLRHADRLKESLLTLGRDRGMAKRRVNVGEMAQRIRPLVTRLVGPQAAVTVDIERGHEITIEGDERQLEQVLVNLVVNARDAMAGQGFGAIVLSVSSEVLTSHERERSEVVIRVSDTGPGIPEAMREEVFEPFYTTRTRGSGTGLGLALCRAIVEEHGGRIGVLAREGTGTTFEVRIPCRCLSRPQPSDAILRGVRIYFSYAPGHTRSIIVGMLESLGMRVVHEASSAQIALTPFEARSGEEGGGIPTVLIADGSVSGAGMGEDAVVLQRPFDRDGLATALVEATRLGVLGGERAIGGDA